MNAFRRAVAALVVTFLLTGCLTAASSSGAIAGPVPDVRGSVDEPTKPIHEHAALPWVVAHRGASHFAPENTYPSFRQAIRNGADRIEMDVQRTKDHKLVLLHDASLRRTTNVEKVFPKLASPSVDDLTYKELRRLDAGRWKGKSWKGTRIPKLSRVLRLGRRHHVRMLVELKDVGRYPGLVKQTLRMFRKRHLMRRGHSDPVQLQGFDIGAMRRASRWSRRVDVGLLYAEPPAKLKKYRWAQGINSSTAKLSRRWVRRAQHHGIRIVAWNVNTTAAIDRAMRMNVDGISTNRPRSTRRLLVR